MLTIFFPTFVMAYTMFALCKAGITHKSKQSDCRKWQLCSSHDQQLVFYQKGKTSDPNPHVIIISSEIYENTT